MTDAVDTLVGCHGRLASLLGSGAEPLEVLRRAEEHRLYWRPEHVRVLLLAESHVYTTTEELDRAIVLPASCPPDLPRGFVRLVYCLGYGENRLLNRPIDSPPNGGTPQFWKIFYSCANAVAGTADFAPIQSTTPAAQRVENKVALLRRLRELGVWLLDTSPAALYLPARPKVPTATLHSCLQIGWDHHIRHAVRRAAPSHIICIGRGVARALGDRLKEFGARLTVVAQPNARLSSADHEESFRTYGRVVREANGLA